MAHSGHFGTKAERIAKVERFAKPGKEVRCPRVRNTLEAGALRPQYLLMDASIHPMRYPKQRAELTLRAEGSMKAAWVLE